LFRVNKTEMVNKTFRMPVKLVKQLDKLAHDNDISTNNLVIQCCEYALANLADDSKEE